MERHKCKLCTRTFINGRALGGHMKAHLATLPLPSKPPSQLGHDSVSSSSSDEEQEMQLMREKHKKRSFKLSDYSKSDDITVQDRESETESKHPTRKKRSKRSRKSEKLSSVVESPPADLENVSSVSNTCSDDQDVAMCLIMLSRDKWIKNKEKESKDKDLEQDAKKKAKKPMDKKRLVKNRCEKCGKCFRSYRAMLGHKKICCLEDEKIDGKIFECPYCYQVFGSGQALGGHKRSHLLGCSSTTSDHMNMNVEKNSDKVGISFIDLNLPAPMEDEDEDDSIVSDA